MDSRKVSSLSVKSDGSDSSLNRGHNLLLEQIGDIPVNEAGAPTSVTASGNLVCVQAGETHVLLQEVKVRPDSEVVVNRRALIQLPGVPDKFYHDVAIFQVGPGEFRLCLLGERKNKERFISTVAVESTGRSLSLGEELCTYDKASMLGKGLSHILPFPEGQNGESDILAFSNIIRKLKVEDRGAVIKPTSGRVPIPPECMDGTISVCISETKKGFSLITSSKTKSAGKNKYQINWYHGKKDELSVPSGKSSIKLPEEQEPSVILADPRDSRSAYVITNNSADDSSSLCKLVRGRKLEEPITSFPFLVHEAVFLTGPDRSLFLLVLNVSSLKFIVYHLTKTEGYRGLQAIWSMAPEFQKGSSNFYHALSCSQSRWQLQGKMADYLLSNRCGYQLGLATLLHKGDIALEPESSLPYRLRLLGGDGVNDVLLVLLDDIERIFEAEEESLSNMNLKVCMNGSPGREGMSQISGWLMAGRISCVEIYSTRLEADSPVGGSDRLVVHSISSDLFRSYIVEQDWTQTTKKEGTFVLESTVDSGYGGLSGGIAGNLVNPATIRTSTPASRPSSNRSRIPSASNRRSLNLDNCSNLSGVNGMSFSGKAELSAVVGQVEETIAPLARANAQIRDSLEALERHLVQLKVASGGGGGGLQESGPDDYLEA